MADIKKLVELGSRVVNNKMLEDKATGISDENDIREYCSRVFGDGSVNPDIASIHQFNNVVVKNADEIVKPMATELLNLFADYIPVRPGDIYAYKKENTIKAKFKWAANGTGVDLVRIESGTKSLAVPQSFSTGFYYEPLDMVQDSVDNYRKLVNNVADAKLRLYLNQVVKIFRAAVANGTIPSNNVKVGSDLTLSDFNKLSSRISRVGNGGKPVFIADTVLIDYFAMQQTSDATASKILSDRIKDELLTQLNINNIGRTTAVNLVNPYTDDTNTAVELPVNEGYFFSSVATNKPIIIAEYGGMRQTTEQDPEDERIKIIIKQEAAIEFVSTGANVGYIKENNTSKVSL